MEKHRDLINELTRQHQELIAKAVESSQRYWFENETLYLQYPDPLTNISARILIDSQHKPILDAVAKSLAFKVQVC
jgi:hypothetical protein